jgi:hypothetical protein
MVSSTQASLYTEIPYQIITKYKAPLLSGCGVGGITNLACRYYKVRHRGFLTGSALTGAAALVAWYYYAQEIREDLNHLRARADIFVVEVTDSVEKRLAPWMNRILGNINEKYNDLVGRLDLLSIEIQRTPQKTVDMLKKQFDELKYAIDHMTPPVDPVMRKQLDDIILQIKTMSTGMDQAIAFIELLKKMMPV